MIFPSGGSTVLDCQLTVPLERILVQGQTDIHHTHIASRLISFGESWQSIEGVLVVRNGISGDCGGRQETRPPRRLMSCALPGLASVSLTAEIMLTLSPGQDHCPDPISAHSAIV